MKKTRHRPFLLCGLLVLVTLAAFEPVRLNGFVKLDDPDYVTQQPNVERGLTRDGIVWAFTTQEASNWHPLTWMSHMLDVELYGLSPVGHHTTNLVLHIASTLLLFLVFRRMTGTIWQSAFVAAVFAVHPLRVESVVWAAERKDVLSALFFMLTLTAYVRYARRPGVRRYLLVVLALALGLLAKPMLVTLPFVLLLLDYWPLGRFRSVSSGCEMAKRRRKEKEADKVDLSPWRLIGEKLPLFFLVLLSSVITFVVQQRGGAVEGVPFEIRLPNALLSYIRYIAKTLWPNHLAVMYPYPLSPPPVWQTIAAALFLAGATAAAVWFGRRRGYLTVGWLWYVGTLVPVIGLVQVGHQAYADRYTYLPSVGLAILVAWGAAELTVSWRLRVSWVTPLAVSVVLALVIGTRIQVRHWRDSISLFEHAIEVTDDNYVMYTSLGAELGERGKIDKAIESLQEAVRINPEFDHAHYNLAVDLQLGERIDEAVHHYREALRITPDYVNANYNLAGILASRGEIDEAIRYFQLAVEAAPEFTTGRFALATALRASGDLAGATKEFQEILRSDPGNASVHYELGRTLLALGRVDEAIQSFQRVIELQPDLANAYYLLANALESRGKREEATRMMQRYRSLTGQ